MRKSLLISVLLTLIFSVKTFSAEGDTYNFSWLDPDKEVYVLQNRKYRKKDRFHLNLGYGVTTSGAFVDATTMQGRAGYFFKEEWGVELLYAVNSGEENDTAASVRRTTVPFRRIVDSYYGGMLMWSPFYAKINIFNTIVYFDWMLGAGVAKLEETNNRGQVLNSATGVDTTETHNAFMWDTAFKFYLTKNWEARVDLTVLHYKAETARVQATDTTTEEFYSNWDLGLSIGYTF